MAGTSSMQDRPTAIVNVFAKVKIATTNKIRAAFHSHGPP